MSNQIRLAFTHLLPSVHTHTARYAQTHSEPCSRSAQECSSACALTYACRDITMISVRDCMAPRPWHGAQEHVPCWLMGSSFSLCPMLACTHTKSNTCVCLCAGVCSDPQNVFSLLDPSYYMTDCARTWWRLIALRSDSGQGI